MYRTELDDINPTEINSSLDNSYVHKAVCFIAQYLTETTRINVITKSYRQAHQVHDNWKITTDSSVENNRGDYGLELVSPILRGQEGLEEVKIMLNALQSLDGTKINSSCGTHVHVGSQDATAKKVKNLLKFVAKYRPEISSILPPSRRTDSFRWAKNLMWDNNCVRDYDTRRVIFTATPMDLNSFSLGIDKVINNCKKHNLDDYNSIMRLHNYLGTRYKDINFEKFLKYNTMEFRQYGGTLDFEKLGHWIVFCTNTIDKCFKTRSIEIKRADWQNNFINVFGEKQSRKVLRFFEDRAVQQFGFHTYQGAYNKAIAIRQV